MKKVSGDITIAFHRDPKNPKAEQWMKKIQRWLKKKHPSVRVVKNKATYLIVLGGDRTILEASHKYGPQRPIIVGLNLGRVGFLASIRQPKNFLAGITALLEGKYIPDDRMMLQAKVTRGKKVVFESHALNDVVVQNLLGMVNLRVGIKGHPIYRVFGTGVLVSTTTGSTGYNLSAHGPIVAPSIKGFIVSELFDHNIPTPSIIMNQKEQVRIRVEDFRKHGALSLTKTGEKVDVILIADGYGVFPIKKGDVVDIQKSPYTIHFAKLRTNYFFKSLQEKFELK